MNNKSFEEVLITMLLTLSLILGLSALFALPVMLLWNWLMPAIFGITKITFCQALGLTFLCSALFKSNPNSNK